CGWCHATHVGRGYAPDCEVLSSGPSQTIVECYRVCEAGAALVTHTVKYTLAASDGSVVRENQVGIQLGYDKPELLDLALDNRDGNYVIEGYTARGAQFRLTSGAPDSPSGISSTLEKVGSGSRVLIRVDGPAPFVTCP